MIRIRIGAVALAGALLAGLGAAGSAAAGTGCNGVVNPAVWGCAPWDNNNGPQFPYYKAPAQGSVAASRGYQPQLTDQQKAQIAGGANLVGAGAGNLVGAGAGNIVGAGAGNLRSK